MLFQCQLKQNRANSNLLLKRFSFDFSGFLLYAHRHFKLGMSILVLVSDFNINLKLYINTILHYPEGPN